MSDPVPPPSPVERWWVKPALAFSLILVFAGTLVAVLWIKNDTLQTTMFTTAGAAFLTAVGFYFGGAASGAKKDDTIATIATQAKLPPA